MVLGRDQAQIRAVSRLLLRASHIDHHRISGHGRDAQRLPGI